ncbi:MAG: CoA-acylating methylmalonate-semialdehyde dehydrogenase [Intrasporangium sp.]|uniref:CoA-acylating methylmalonate-semialdehyde dehydrogenase n=1 Tax=Intrasporangium sp. TaxID=1925024 RepID=UPI002648D42E|nr:CoA-acylating methylmalonate-semialdehyde dehydrogenase [Intrasporangium sp.]MDN5796873.1 CoA-acylating methylmalonate-semialdehyde dehydrogenase [Intrasporangium sp.]
MTKLIEHWIGGAPSSARGSRRAPVFNPATGEQTGEVVFATAAEVDGAVKAAAAAAQGWRETPLARRAQVLFRFRELLAANTGELAALVTAEQGKVISDARGEIARGMESVEFATGITQLLKGEFSEQVSAGIDVHSVRQPLGVVAGITPFNFPVMVPLWMCANAIACGNAFVLKPSEKDPSAALFLADLWRQAGLPDGVFTVMQGDKEAVDALIEHHDVAALSFVGSTPIARAIYAKGAAAGKRVQALGGAKNHMVVMPDADIELAADSAVVAAYGAAGERCMAVSVVLAVGAAADPLIESIRARLPGLVVGDGADETTDVGPLISAAHRDRVRDYITAGEQDGAMVLVDGRRPDDIGGYFVGPTLIDAVTPEMSIYTDEIFGPVLGVVRVDSLEQAVGLINDHEFGNGTAIFTRDGGVSRRFQFEVKIGMVGINVPIPVPVAYHSFGGWKGSLFGDAHMYGPEGINFFTRGKVVTTRWSDSPELTDPFTPRTSE